MRSLAEELRVYSSGSRRCPTLKYEPMLVKLPSRLRECFECSHRDAETEAFLQTAKDFSLWKLLASDLLRLFVSRTTANGLLGRGGMFVLSTEQATSLLRPAQLPEPPAQPSEKGRRAAVQQPQTPMGHRTLLDIGAGDGGVTAKLAPLVDRVYATEYSATMRWRLQRRGYTVLDHASPFLDVEHREQSVYDIIACLNVLDRADTPLTLLREMRDALRPGTGTLLLAVVLPWCPFVEYNNQQRRPRELLPMRGGQCCKGATFEDSLAALVENVLEPVGYELVRWTKLPYLCEGNLRLEYALLHDAVLVLRRKEGFVDTAALAPASEYA